MMTNEERTCLSLFCGLGGMSLGFLRAGFKCVGAFDSDPEAVADHKRITGYEAQVADLATMTPADLRAACVSRPNVLVTSPPCKGASGCLPEKWAKTEKYQKLNSLTLRGVWLALEAWPEDPPDLIVLENVPRINTRMRHLLDTMCGMLHAYGYAVRESTHDCGELGGLGQRRRRFLLVARRVATVPEVLYEPPKRRVKSVGEVLGELPVPLPDGAAGGPMHRLPKLSALNWVRLALIPPGGDWRDLPESVHLVGGDARHAGAYGVEDWEREGHTVLATAKTSRSWVSVTDPRVARRPGKQNGGHGVEGWDDPSHAVVATAQTNCARVSVCDPRISGAPRSGVYGVQSAEDPSVTVIAQARPDNGRYAVAETRVAKDRRYGLGVRGFEQHAHAVTASGRPCNHSVVVADPRVTYEQRKGCHGVENWATPSHTVIGASTPLKGQAVADPRVPEVVGPELDLESTTPIHLVIVAEDGTWHRPMTTLELAALQGLPLKDVAGEWLVLEGRSHQRWRQRIGNACPPAAAEAIGRQMMRTLDASFNGVLLMSSTPVWVEQAEEVVAHG